MTPFFKYHIQMLIIVKQQVTDNSGTNNNAGPSNINLTDNLE